MTHLIVIPLYPQFSISTSGSSLRLLEEIFENDPAFNDLKHSVIASWYADRLPHKDPTPPPGAHSEEWSPVPLSKPSAR